MTYNIMLQSTLSGSGKSLIAAAICRYFHKRGYEVSPFKSLNISLNSYITPDGREIGMSQAFQSWACGKEPCHQMNPILLKATGNRASQAIVNGVPRKEFERHGKEGPVTPILERAYRYLEERNDIIVIEGSGTPSEINLNDIANMNTAELFKSPVILIGDIDTGGVFAGLYGTYQLLSEEHKRLIKGYIINKFRGDPSILGSGITRLEKELKAPCLGVMTYQCYSFPEEDSLSMGGPQRGGSPGGDVRDIWLRNLDTFLETMEKEIKFDQLENIMRGGV